MPHKPSVSPLGAFLKALRDEKVPCILIGAMAAVEQGAPLMTIDFDLWVKLPERQYVRILGIVEQLKGTILAQTLYELTDGTQVNVVFTPDGLRSFSAELKLCHMGRLEGQSIPILPLARIIASKRAAGREKDLIALPILERTLRLSRRLKLKPKPARKRINKK